MVHLLLRTMQVIQKNVIAVMMRIVPAGVSESTDAAGKAVLAGFGKILPQI